MSIADVKNAGSFNTSAAEAVALSDADLEAVNGGLSAWQIGAAVVGCAVGVGLTLVTGGAAAPLVASVAMGVSAPAAAALATAATVTNVVAAGMGVAGAVAGAKLAA